MQSKEVFMEETQKKLEEAYLVIAYLQAQLVQKNS